MNDHSHYEQLAVLAAGGHLSDEELLELHGHIATCTDCRKAAAQFRELVHFHLPLTRSPLHQRIDVILTRPDSGARERFIRRASLEGIEFSPNVKKMERPRRSSLSFAAAGAGVFSVIAAALFYASQHLSLPDHPANQQYSMQARQQIEQLTQQKSTLEATISRLEHTLAEQQRETEGLRTQMAALDTAAINQRRDAEQVQAEATQSASRSAQSLEESGAQQKIQEKLVADTRGELERLNQARASDQAAIVANQILINELSEQLKTARTNVDMERQFAAAGKEVRDLMGARQLHVVDVRDTDPNGKAGKAFGRVFLTEGKSLIFYAFDLTDTKRIDAKQAFQVWGQQEGKTGSLRSLGFLYVDDKQQRRWSLKTDDPAAIREIDSVFVTVEQPGGAKKPTGQRLLYAYLGEANHP